MTASALRSLGFRSLGLCLALVSPAAAADLSEAAADRWTGPWVGVIVGAGDLGGSGALGGVAGGYAAQFDNLVIGAEGEVSFGGLDGRRLGGRYEVEAFGAIRARVGYAFDRFVAFGTAGVAFASAEFARGGERDRRTQLGWTVGGGVEVAITGALSARAEYLYVDLDRDGFDVPGGASIGPSGGLARFGLNYRF
ncbi:outer membrane protein [Chenggangzhangella methanolivorans]|uniref:Outer membrane beta-barrel protein n=1 Tax=Chenggangzhangella methanolivorans TaxID=1437009 RepID=A0A9E6RDR0_9HYPH|nr:outer membrane beta-barrel protein [Chenggangzhangella methanolivorans]QZN99225.1 outer membrane beta-barrel protein [Chenggangzhangella methanolivorans]